MGWEGGIPLEVADWQNSWIYNMEGQNNIIYNMDKPKT